MRKIDERLSLSATAAPILDESGRANAESAAQPAAGIEISGPTKPTGAARTDVGGGGVTPLAAVHATLALPGIGLGYASLDALEDTETAFVLNAGGLTTIASGVNGYYVKSDNPMDALLTRIMGFDHANGFSDTSHAIGNLSPFAFSATHLIDSGKDRAYDVTGATAADSIQSGNSSDIIHGLAGNDTISGGQGDDLVWGGAGNDSITGDNGNDQLWGGAGVDTLDGGLGDDFLFGGSSNDTLLGGDGNDLLLGGTGNDSLTGGEGDDVLVGGAGADTLTGSAGHDLFIFAEGDSGVGSTGQDTVADFTIGEDTLDLTGFTRKLHVVSAFGHHAYEMVLTDSADGTLIQIDLNGDGVSDQEIAVTTTDQAHLTSADYVI